MKRVILVSALMLALTVSTGAFGWSGDWNNSYPFGGPVSEDCPGLPTGSLIQLIHAGPNLVVDDPIALFLTQPDPQAALDAWLLAGTPPVGDDSLFDSTATLYFGPGLDGYFAKTISSSDNTLQGAPFYTRFFTGAQDQIIECDWYGEVGDPNDPDDPIYEMILQGGSGGEYDFGEYVINITDVCADQHISIPEPATMAIAGIALLLGFFKRKK